MSKKKVVILFTRLSGYILNVYENWIATSEVELYIFCKEVDKKEAPFRFSNEYDNMRFYNEEDFTSDALQKKVQTISPDMILCAGWSNKKYLKVASKHAKQIPTVMSMDTQWNGRIKQYVALVASRLFLTRVFSYVWVPGKPQVNYAKKLGFKERQIFEGFYVADSKNFNMEVINPKKVFKKRFVFVGRYIEIKGIKDLWQAFVELQNETPNEWELHCIGTGPLYDERVLHPKIKHIGFVQPDELKNYISEGGVFVLPSHYEPWGVVVHEFALAGFPMIVSDVIGSASAFVDADDGFVFKASDVSALKNAMMTVSRKNEDELKVMGRSAYEKALTFNERHWAETANYFLNGRDDR